MIKKRRKETDMKKLTKSKPKKQAKKANNTAQKSQASACDFSIIRTDRPNPFVEDSNHVGQMTVRQLVGLVMEDEFPKGLDTVIRIGDVEGNLGVNGVITVTAHKPDDVILAIDPHCGDEEYDPGA